MKRVIVKEKINHVFIVFRGDDGQSHLTKIFRDEDDAIKFCMEKNIEFYIKHGYAKDKAEEMAENDVEDSYQYVNTDSGDMIYVVSDFAYSYFMLEVN